MAFITVFTPTFNRAYTLRRLFDSLINQTNHNFEWLVIDDGSTDQTEQLFDEFKKKQLPFNLRYNKTENRGKQRAINMAVTIAKGDYLFIVDSDDFLLDNAIEKIYKWIQSIDKLDEFAGVSGVIGNLRGEPLNKKMIFEKDYIDCTNLEREKYNLQADMSEIYKISVLRKYPFKVWYNENFVPEATVWDEIALDGYKLRWFNDVIYLCDYQEDGLTKGSWNLLKNNPMGYAMLFNHQLKHTKFGKKMFQIICQMLSCIFLAKECGYIKESNALFFTVLLIPIGYLIYLRRKLQFINLN